MRTELVALCEALAKECENLDLEAIPPESCVALLGVVGTAKLQLEGVRTAVIGRLMTVERQRKATQQENTPPVDGKKILGESHSIWESVERTGKQSPEKVRQEVRRALAVDELYPRFGQAMRAGKISGDYVDILRSLLRSTELQDRAKDNEGWLLDRALNEPIEQFRTSVQAWKFRHSPRSSEKQAREDKHSEVFRVSRADGGYRLSGWLSAINGQAVYRAIDQAIGIPAQNDKRSPGQRGAEALIDLVHLAIGNTTSTTDQTGAVSGVNTGGGGKHDGENHGNDRPRPPGKQGTVLAPRVGARYQMLVHVPLSTLVKTEQEIHHGCSHLNCLDEVLNDVEEQTGRQQTGRELSGRKLSGREPPDKEQSDSVNNTPGEHRSRPGRGALSFATLPPCPVSGAGIGGQGRCLDGRPEVTSEVNQAIGKLKSVIKSGVCPDEMEGFDPARLTDGTPLAPSQLARLMCSSGISRIVLTAHGEPLDASRSQRRFSTTQEKAIMSRDRTCRYPGCGRGLELSEIHHAHEWHQGGPTTVDNAILLCFHHHQYIHNEHIIITHHTGGFVFTRKNGTIVGVRHHETNNMKMVHDPGESR